MNRVILQLGVAVLLLICLFDMPYGFYALVRFVAMAAFAYLSYRHFKAEQEGLGFLFAALAVLFQPFFKITLGRTLWNVVDVAAAAMLCYFAVKTLKKDGQSR